MRFHALMLCLLLCPILGSGLRAQTLVRPREALDALKSRPKFIAGLDSRRSFISDRDVNIFGMRVGLEFDNRVRMGFGTYFLASHFSRNFVVDFPGGGLQLDTIPAKLHFSYFSYFLEYVVFFSKRWEIGVPFYLGLGEVNFPEVPGFRKQPVLLGQLILRADYKIFPFIGLAGGIGYRQILAGRPIIQENFNAPIYTFGLKIWLDWFAKKLFPKQFGAVN